MGNGTRCSTWFNNINCMLALNQILALTYGCLSIIVSMSLESSPLIWGRSTAQRLRMATATSVSSTDYTDSILVAPS